MQKEIEEVLKEIRARLQMDGGDIELVEVKGGKVTLRLKGACASCPMAQITLKGFIEKTLKEKIAGIKEVQAI